jgi:hypothetical protein
LNESLQGAAGLGDPEGFLGWKPPLLEVNERATLLGV